MKTKIFVIALFAVILVLGFSYYQLQKRTNEYLEHVETISSVLSVNALDIQNDIDDFEKLKSDTSTIDYKNGTYQEIHERGETSSTGYRLFVLAISLRENKKNQNELNKLIDACEIPVSNIQYFYIDNKNFSDIRPGELDKLIGYYKNLKSITEKIEKIKIEL